MKEFLTKPFDLHEGLCRFLIVLNDEDYSLYEVFHHIIFDALSKTVFTWDLSTILEGLYIPPENSFLKVSAFNQQIQKTQEYSEAKSFYDNMLIDIDETNDLIDLIGGESSGYYSSELDIDLTDFFSRNKISENALFTSVFAYTLSRFTGSEKALFNIIENGRSRFNNFDSIGMFANTLPIIIDCKNQDIDSFMDYISNRVYDVMKYNYYPFRLLANEYNINSNILFQFMPDWIKEDEILKTDSSIIQEMSDMIADLTVEVIQRGDNYNLSITYSDKYSNEFIKSFASSYELILNGMLNANKLGDINYTLASDLDIINQYNSTETKLNYNDILDAFNDCLIKNQNNNLVSFKDTNYTYAERAFIADKIAKKLVDLGIKLQDNVSFLVDRSELYMFCVLGILSAGATYVPLDDKLPEERIDFIIKDSQSKIIIVSNETLERVENLKNDDLSILNLSDILNEDIGSLNKLPIEYGELACILYTSGTTGIPKGVKFTRKSLLNVSQSYVDIYDLSSADIFGLYSSIGFDVSSFVISAVIYSRACLCVIPEELRSNMIKMNDYFMNHGVTHTFITTQVAKLFMQSIEKTSLDVLLAAGEKLGKVDSPHNYQLIDAYGPTEAFAFVSSINNSLKINESSVGLLNNNTKAYILDDEFRIVPNGAVGELYLAGYQVAKGYLNREEETNKAFIENPFDDNPEYGTLYRTGDMARILPDGSLGIVGRRDSQIKVRGNRVELQEIESVIREIDFVLDATVQTILNEGNNELVAYVVVSNDLDSNELADRVREYVGEHKPSYMVPLFVIPLDHIPLNVNGKVDRQALPDVDLDSLHVDYVKATNETEKHIIDAFETVFEQKNISLFDDFVRLGGDSIKAIRLISMLQEKDIFCTAGNILNHRPPYLIAQNLEENKEAVHYESTEGLIDLLPIQEYFFDQINSNIFIQQFIVKAKENLDKDILQKSFDELTNIHDILRVRYNNKDGKQIQEILPLNTHIVEINEYSILENFEKAIWDIFIDSSYSINLENKLIDVSLIHYEGISYLMIVIHHLIVDGVSWNILLSDLTYIYYRLKAGKEIDISRPYPYKNWIKDVKELVKDISIEEKQHWKEVHSLLDNSEIKGPSNVFSFKDVNHLGLNYASLIFTIRNLNIGIAQLHLTF